jgi:hypothetical protein
VIWASTVGGAVLAGTTMTTETATTFLGAAVPPDQVVVGCDGPAARAERFPGGHPVGAAVAVMHAELDGVTDTGLWTLQPAELRALVRASARLTARLEELELRVACAADRADVGGEGGSTSTAVWWADETRQTRTTAIRRLKLARALDFDHEPVRDALSAGELLVEQAEVIVHAIQTLTTGAAKDLVEPDAVRLAERELIRLARHHDAKELRILGRRMLDVVAPEVGEAVEARLLAAEERQAMAQARFTMSEAGYGSAHGRFTLPAHHAQMLRKHLMALASPVGKSNVGTPAGDAGWFSPGRLGQAFMAYVERYPTSRLPTAGGIAADVVVTLDYAALLSGLGSAQLDTGAVISPATARMMACDAGLIPLVLGGRSLVLDCGRKRRFHSKAQRIAIAVRDRGCSADGCDYPPGLCHVHHNPSWSSGGGTDVEHGRLLCPKHHHRAHDRDYRSATLPNGKITFARRT